MERDKSPNDMLEQIVANWTQSSMFMKTFPRCVLDCFWIVISLDKFTCAGNKK